MTGLPAGTFTSPGSKPLAVTTIVTVVGFVMLGLGAGWLLLLLLLGFRLLLRRRRWSVLWHWNGRWIGRSARAHQPRDHPEQTRREDDDRAVSQVHSRTIPRGHEDAAWLQHTAQARKREIEIEIGHEAPSGRPIASA